MYNAIQSTTSASAITLYVEKDDRCAFISGIGCSAATVREDFADTRRRHFKNDLKIQAYSEVISASRDEVDPSDPEAVYRFHLFSCEDARRKYPGRQALIGTQIDGATGLAHSHVIINNVAHQDAELTYPLNGKPVTEKVTAGHAFTSAMSNVFRIRAATNTLLADEDFMTSIGSRPYDNQALIASTRTGDAWLIELEERIRTARDRAGDETEFTDLLQDDGAITIRTRGKKKVYSFTYTDTTGKARTARAGSKRLPSQEFSRAAILTTIDENQAAAQQAELVALAAKVVTRYDPITGRRVPSGFETLLRNVDRMTSEEVDEAVAAYQALHNQDPATSAGEPAQTHPETERFNEPDVDPAAGAIADKDPTAEPCDDSDAWEGDHAGGEIHDPSDVATPSTPTAEEGEVQRVGAPRTRGDLAAGFKDIDVTRSATQPPSSRTSTRRTDGRPATAADNTPKSKHDPRSRPTAPSQHEPAEDQETPSGDFEL